jgi:SUKH-3 immunity protein
MAMPTVAKSVSYVKYIIIDFSPTNTARSTIPVAMPNPTGLPNSVLTVFAAAGWEVDRRVTVPSLVPHSHPAHAVLAEFGGLMVGQNGRGEECAKHALLFGYIEPGVAVLRWADLLQSPLIGVAEMEDGHAELYVDASDRWFFASCIHDAFAFEPLSLCARRRRLQMEPYTQVRGTTIFMP